MRIQIVIEADFNEEELAKLKDEKTGLIPSKGEYADGIIVGHDNGIGMIHVYNQKELCSAIEEVEKGEDYYKSKREQLLPIFYEGTMYNAAKNILKYFEIT